MPILFSLPRVLQRALWVFISVYTLLMAMLPAPARAQIQLKLSSQAASDTVTTPRVTAQLVALAPQGIAPGQPLTLGLRIAHQPEWHTYWKNAGDSGLPTQLNWELPTGMQAGEIQWPTPTPIRVADMLNYGYEGEVLLPVPVTVGDSFAPDASGNTTLRLHASWLVCRVECIPEEGTLELTLPTSGSHAFMAAEFAQALAAQPQPLPQAQASATAHADSDRITLQVQGLPAAAQGHTLHVLPESSDTLLHAAVLGTDWQQAWQGDVWTAELPLHPLRGDTPTHLPLVLAVADNTAADASHPALAWRVEAAVQGRWQAAQLASISPALAAALEANAAASPAPVVSAAPTAISTRAWLMALLGGLVGGLILNLMPCVFPVLAIKLLGIARHSDDRRAQRHSGWAYTAGVVLSFVALGALLLALRAAGEQLGWGFQLQNPLVVSMLAALFTLIGLNLAGLFEFGSVLPNRIANAHARHPVADAFLSGVLAVAIASPCTAPFMGASLGFAIGMPTAQALTVFAALGVGMALPYVLVSLVPALVRWLPRPGAWMDTFRRAMAFPMFATVVWLVWVLGQQSGIDGAATLLAMLVLLAAVVWALTLRGHTRAVLLVSLLAALGWFVASQGRNLTTPPPAATASASGLWQPWSDAAQSAALAQQQPVFVDYTAAWCVTCQYNKRHALAAPAVLDAFSQHNVALLRADWTRRDPAITAALANLGRSGVPVYVLLAPGRAPVVLSELLSESEVLAALQTL